MKATDQVRFLALPRSTFNNQPIVLPPVRTSTIPGMLKITFKRHLLLLLVHYTLYPMNLMDLNVQETPPRSVVTLKKALQLARTLLVRRWSTTRQVPTWTKSVSSASKLSQQVLVLSTGRSFSDHMLLSVSTMLSSPFQLIYYTTQVSCGSTISIGCITHPIQFQIKTGHSLCLTC